jgi:large subunit ribosomal protein L25
MAEALNVKKRETRGKRNAKRMRYAGTIPAVLYGHGEESKSLTVVADEMALVVRHGGRVVELKGDVNEKAFIRAMQWDVYGTEVLHVDFTRVSEHERVEVKVSVELRGQAPGVKDGGAVEHIVHEIEIECEALSIPEKIEVSIKELKIGDTITAAEVKLPEGATLISDPDDVIVHCVIHREEEEGEGEGGTAEPEVIGRKADDEGEAEE